MRSAPVTPTAEELEARLKEEAERRGAEEARRREAEEARRGDEESARRQEEERIRAELEERHKREQVGTISRSVADKAKDCVGSPLGRMPALTPSECLHRRI